jgi:dTDP-4-amino-4,6-dideoxygalactose transaminase
MEPYRSYFPHAGLLLPETERLSDRVMVLPTGTATDPELVERMCRLIRYIVEHGPEISRRLGTPAVMAPAV